MIGFNGGLIGGFRNTTNGTASVPGVWTANEQVVAQRRGVWLPPDPFFSSVSLLLPGDGANGSTSIIDRSPSPKAVTANGNAQISTAQSVFGGSSIAFDGNGDFLSVASTNDLVFGTGNLTFEFWIYPNALSAATLYDSRPFGINGNYFVIGIDSSNVILINVNAVTVLTSTSTCAAGQFTHVAVVRSSGTLTIYISGVASGSVANSTNFLDSGIASRIGATVNNTSYFNGFIDDLRATKGVARYTANFTPPTAPHPLS